MHRSCKLQALACLYLLPVLAFVGCAAPVRADPGGVDKRQAGITAANRSTLAEALAGVSHETEIALAVSAEEVELPEGNSLPVEHASVAQIAAAFGEITRRFGTVLAIAPATMTVLNTNPANPDLYADLTPPQALKYLVALLAPEQWQALTSERGLGFSDLNSDVQRHLFLSLIPDPLNVTAYPTTDPLHSTPSSQTVPDDHKQVRLRLGQTVEMALPLQGRTDRTISRIPDSPDSPPRYNLLGGWFEPHKTFAGVLIRTEEPNTPKRGQLNLESANLARQVSLEGLTSIQELIARIRQVTGVELYADRRYESKSLAVITGRKSAPAADLLRAVALCLTATYRRVGPAYVLTDDLQGIGTRRQLIKEFADHLFWQRQALLAEAGDRISAQTSLSKLPWYGDPLALSAEQAAHFRAGDGFISFESALNQLTPGQQAAALRAAEETGPKSFGPDGKELHIDLSDPTRKLSVWSYPNLQLLAPSLKGPIETHEGQFLSQIFDGLSKAPTKPGAIDVPTVSSTDLKALLEPIAQRAVLAQPHTVAELNALVAQMKEWGLNQLWLVVFSDGFARVPRTPFSIAHEPDLLTAALKATAGTGIVVYPVVDVFTWGTDIKPALADVTILGENSIQAAAREQAMGELNIKSGGIMPFISHRAVVSPFSEEVTQALAALMKTIANRPGIAGMVWRETDPAGYDLPVTYRMYDSRRQLGYTETPRLAFLRQEHVDPVDIYPERIIGTVDTTLPTVDFSPASNGLQDRWRVFRASANLDLLKSLYAILPAHITNADTPQLFLKQRRSGYILDWYGTWDGLDKPIPTHHRMDEDAKQDGPPSPDQEPVMQANAQSKTALIRLTLSTGNTLQSGTLAAQIKKWVAGTRWKGFVVDLTAPMKQ